MGEAYSYKCDKCSHVESLFLGIGYTYPMMLKELKEEILAGMHGKAAMEALKKYPESNVQFENQLYICSHCGEVEIKKHILIHTPDGKNVYMRYRCQSCHGILRMTNTVPESMSCPECGGTLHIDLKKEILWD